jgi:hypothetical protein
MNEVRYVIVAGVLWLRYTNEPAVWLATWTGEPRARTWQVDELPHMDVRRAGGAVDGAAWDLRFSGPGRPYAFPHRLARPLAKTQFVVEEPALSVSGWFEVDGERHELEDAPGHRAHVWGTRYADDFLWAHANVDATGWVELLAACAPRLPMLAAYADERRTVSAPWHMPFVRDALAPERSRVSPYEVPADRGDFVGVTYHDPDGTALFCYHTERARLTGPGLEAVDVAYEFASRRPLEGWTISI